MTPPNLRLMFYVQHLLGIGHLVRASRIAKALAEDGFDTTVVVGGDLPGRLDFGAARILALPPVKAGPAGFGELVTDSGALFGEADKAHRRDRLLSAFQRLRPDILLIEAFPFGRRQMRFELLPLLAAAVDRARPPLIAASIRDILQENKKPERDAETIDLVRRFFDRVIVHGDPALFALEASFPAARAIAGRLAYSGLVGPPRQAAAERFDVIVSVGGGAVGAELLQAAVAARPMTRLRDARWLVLTGPNLPVEARPAAQHGLEVRTFDPDLPGLLHNARVSVSQAGYNTVADVLSTEHCGMVLVPFAEGGETEQSRRAAALSAAGLAVVLEPTGFSPGAVAAAIDQVLDLPPRSATFQFDGARQTARLLREAVAARAGAGKD